jgi:hypothetical protein
MLTLKNEKEKQDELKTNATAETDLEKWEKQQLDIFSDIIISILLKTTLKKEEHEK